MSKRTPKHQGPAKAGDRSADERSARAGHDEKASHDEKAGHDEKADSVAVDAAAEIGRALEDEDAMDNTDGVDELTSVRAELDDSKDRALRLAAELENYRKRVSRQKEEDLRYANMRLIRDTLPVLDNMSRAIEAAEKSADASGLLQGFQMVVQQLQDVLKQHHCETIEALHQPFDPHLHQAVTQQVSDEFPANTVLAVVQVGYHLYDRVVRPSQVIVSKPSEEE